MREKMKKVLNSFSYQYKCDPNYISKQLTKKKKVTLTLGRRKITKVRYL